MNWEELEPSQQDSLARLMLQGSKATPGNMTRAKEQIASNPKLFRRLLNESGIDGSFDEQSPGKRSQKMSDDPDAMEEANEQVTPDPNDVDSQRSIESKLDELIAEEEEEEYGTEAENTNSLTTKKGMPAPLPNESAKAYIARIQAASGAASNTGDIDEYDADD